MLKKLILSVALVTSFATATNATTTKADTLFAPTANLDYRSLTTLSAASNSLDALTEAMNQTVSQVSKENAVLPATPKAQSAADKLVSIAKKYIGVPYVWGGTTPAGFDCSGFTSYVYREALGKKIGRTTWAQIANGKEVPLDQAKVGDLIIFYGGGHVGIYLGNGQIIHAPEPGESVKISSITSMPADFALHY